MSQHDFQLLWLNFIDTYQTNPFLKVLLKNNVVIKKIKLQVENDIEIEHLYIVLYFTYLNQEHTFFHPVSTEFSHSKMVYCRFEHKYKTYILKSFIDFLKIHEKDFFPNSSLLFPF